MRATNAVNGWTGRAAVLLLGCIALGARAQQMHQPLPIEEAVTALSFALGARVPISLSADGEWLAYSLEDPRRRQSTPAGEDWAIAKTGAPGWLTSDVWITQVKTGRSQNLTGGQGRNWAAVWSPNGEYLAFFSDRSGQLLVHLWERKTGQLRAASDAVVRATAFDVIRWSADSRRILVRPLPEGMTVERIIEQLSSGQRSGPEASRVPGATASIYRAKEAEHQEAANAWTYLYLGDLAWIDVLDGRVQRLARGLRPHESWISPDGANVAFTSSRGHRGDTPQYLADLYVVPANGSRQPRLLASGLLQAGSDVSWSPTGRWLSYTGEDLPQEGQDSQLARGEWAIVSIDGGGPHKLTQSAPSVRHSGPPLWDAKGENLYLPAGDAVLKASVHEKKVSTLAQFPGRSVLSIAAARGSGRFWSSSDGALYARFRDRDTKREGFYKIDPASGKASTVLEGDLKLVSNMDIAAGTIAYLAEDSQHDQNIWLVDADFRNPRQATRINPQFERSAMGSSRLIEWHGLHGQRLQGAVLLPPDYDPQKRYPVIVEGYGGDRDSEHLNRFGFKAGADNRQLLATRGYVVFMPDIVPLRLGTPMRDIADAVLPGIDKLIELGIADPERLGVMGLSYGGYTTLSLLVQTTRFKAAVSTSGIGNLVTLYGSMTRAGSSFSQYTIGEMTGAGRGNIGGTPWQVRERYIENSPYFYLDRVETPLLLVCGALDETTPPVLSEEVFTGLRRLGKEAVLVRYEGEEHAVPGGAVSPTRSTTRSA